MNTLWLGAVVSVDGTSDVLAGSEPPCLGPHTKTKNPELNLLRFQREVDPFLCSFCIRVVSGCVETGCL